MLKTKIDFVVYFTVENANPNGDPLSGNMPRQDNELYGLVSDVCIKRKIRNRFQDTDEEIFVKANERIDDGFKSLEKRFENIFPTKEKISDDMVYEKICEKYIDVRSFGQVVTFQKRSIGIRGPVSITMGQSIEPINISSMQITRSTNGMEADVGKQRSSDTMGTKHIVDYGLYCFSGSINAYFAEKTKYTDQDAIKLKEALESLFVNDASSARPDGSMEVKKVYWIEHPNKTGVLSSAKIKSLFACHLKEGAEKHRFEDYHFIESPDEVKPLIELGAKVEILEGL